MISKYLVTKWKQSLTSSSVGDSLIKAEQFQKMINQNLDTPPSSPQPLAMRQPHS